MKNNNYPDWALKHKIKGTTIRRRGDAFILVKVSSKRVPGKKYPVVEQEYLGIITENGLIKKKVYEASSKDELLIEYGLSTFLYLNLSRFLYTHISSNESSSGKILIVVGSILYFIFNDITDDILSLTYLSKLAKVTNLSFLTDKRKVKCISMKENINLYLAQLIPDKNERYYLLGRLRNILLNCSTMTIINNDDTVNKLIEKYNMRMKYETN